MRRRTRRRINQVFDPVLTVHVGATKVRKLVYLLIANRPLRYARGKYSRIVYIGTTERGVRRIASSASTKIVDAVDKIRGLHRLDAYVVWARSRQGSQRHEGMNFWQTLERALLLRFCNRYGRPPILNRVGQRMRERREFEVFKKRTIDRIISRYT